MKQYSVLVEHSQLTDNKTFKVLEKNEMNVIIDGGYWMQRKNYDRYFKSPIRYGMDVDSDTKEITLYFLPT